MSHRKEEEFQMSHRKEQKTTTLKCPIETNKYSAKCPTERNKKGPKVQEARSIHTCREREKKSKKCPECTPVPKGTSTLQLTPVSTVQLGLHVVQLPRQQDVQLLGDRQEKEPCLKMLKQSHVSACVPTPPAPPPQYCSSTLDDTPSLKSV